MRSSSSSSSSSSLSSALPKCASRPVRTKLASSAVTNRTCTSAPGSALAARSRLEQRRSAAASDLPWPHDEPRGVHVRYACKVASAATRAGGICGVMCSHAMPMMASHSGLSRLANGLAPASRSLWLTKARWWSSASAPAHASASTGSRSASNHWTRGKMPALCKAHAVRSGASVRPSDARTRRRGLKAHDA